MAKRRRKIKAGRIILLAALAAVLVFGIITIRYRNNLKPAQKECTDGVTGILCFEISIPRYFLHSS